MESAPPPEAPPRRSRLRRLLIWTGASLGVLVLVVFFGGPPLIGSIARSTLQSILDDRIDGKATVGSVSFSWFSGVTIRDIEIRTARAPRRVRKVRECRRRRPGRARRTHHRQRANRLSATRDPPQRRRPRVNLATLLKPTAPTPTPAAGAGS
jgi:hypothetical protein